MFLTAVIWVTTTQQIMCARRDAGAVMPKLLVLKPVGYSVLSADAALCQNLATKII